MTDRALFVTAPALALLSLGLVVLARHLLLRPRGELPPAVVKSALEIYWSSWPWRIGLVGLALVHLLLLFATKVPGWSGSLPQVLLLELTAMVLALSALIGLLSLVRRFLRGPGASLFRALPFADAALLALLLVEVGSGIAMAARYRWAASWSTVTLAPYLRSLFALEPRLPLVGGMPYLVKLHVFCAVAIVALLPFTQLAYLALLPLDRAVAWLLRPLQAVRRRAGEALDTAIQRGADALSLRREED